MRDLEAYLLEIGLEDWSRFWEATNWLVAQLNVFRDSSMATGQDTLRRLLSEGLVEVYYDHIDQASDASRPVTLISDPDVIEKAIADKANWTPDLSRPGFAFATTKLGERRLEMWRRS